MYLNFIFVYMLMPIESVSFAPHELFLMHEPIRVSEIYPTTTLLPLLLLLPTVQASSNPSIPSIFVGAFAKFPHHVGS